MSKQVSYAQWSLEPYCIGMKLRALRTAKRLTLSRLAVETGLSTALLSKLETDRMVPTLPTLAIISRVYGVSMSHFFSEPEHHTLSITRKSHLLNTSRGLDAVHTVPLKAQSDGRGMQVQMVELLAGTTSSLPIGQRLSALMAYVLEGRLELDVGGMRETLETGDCMCLETEMPVVWSAAGKHPCRILVAIAAA
jgi:HTH-type transcriptional regulator, repressor for puuD